MKKDQIIDKTTGKYKLLYIFNRNKKIFFEYCDTVRSWLIKSNKARKA